LLGKRFCFSANKNFVVVIYAWRSQWKNFFVARISIVHGYIEARFLQFLGEIDAKNTQVVVLPK
jgi:hypothetical protein